MAITRLTGNCRRRIDQLQFCPKYCPQVIEKVGTYFLELLLNACEAASAVSGLLLLDYQAAGERQLAVSLSDALPERIGKSMCQSELKGSVRLVVKYGHRRDAGSPPPGVTDSPRPRRAHGSHAGSGEVSQTGGNP